MGDGVNIAARLEGIATPYYLSAREPVRPSPQTLKILGLRGIECARARRGESGSCRAVARGCSPAACEVLGTARGNEHGAALARSGQAG